MFPCVLAGVVELTDERKFTIPRAAMTGASPDDVYCTVFGNRGAVSEFTDALGWYPGLEYRTSPPEDPADEGLYFRDQDASTVIPSRDNTPYTTRVTDADGNPFTDLYGVVVAGSELGSGNPGDAGVEYGVRIQIRREGRHGQYVHVKVYPAQP